MTQPKRLTEADKKLRKAGRDYRTSVKRVTKVCPDLVNDIAAIIHAEISLKQVNRGETLSDLVDRHCPYIYDAARQQGLELDLNLPENTHENLCLGKIFYRFNLSARH
jgi:hypothetical protein